MTRAALAILFTIATNAAATTVVVQRDAAPVANAEVCRFQAADRENPFKRWLASQEITCVASGTQLTFPRGLWNVFARAGGNSVSGAMLLVDGKTAPETLTLTVERGAAVIPLLPPQRGGVIYAPRRAIAFPAQERVVVPANEDLWLIVVEKSKAVALFPIAPLAPGAEQQVDARGDGPPAVLGWLQVPEADRAALANVTGILTPGVRAFSGAATRNADLLPRFEVLSGAFVRVRDVPAGSAELRLEGHGWLRDQTTVKVENALSLAPQPLRVRAAGSLTVHWSTDTDLVALDHTLGSCNASESYPLVELTVSLCPPGRRPVRPQRPDQPPEPEEPEQCSPIRTEKFDSQPRLGAVTLEDIAPGSYRADVHLGKLPLISQNADVAPLGSKEIWLTLQYEEAYGSLTYGGEPLGEDAVVKFPNGYGFAPFDSTDYRAALRTRFGIDAHVNVAACDGSPRAVILTDSPMKPNTRNDLNIPKNELTINVTDTFTTEPLGGAEVLIEVMSQSRTRVVMEKKESTDNQGRAAILSVPLRELHITVSHAGYQKQRVPPFSMSDRETKTLDVQLMPLRGNRGKIVSGVPFDRGMVLWYAPDGRESERAELAADGTFVYANWHPAEETMAVVSLSHPLWVLRSPAVERRETITLKFPEMPARAFEVSVTAAAQRNWHIGVVVGGVRVPQPALAIHQMLRREAAVARPGRPMKVRDLLSTGPIDVLLGPTTDEITARLAAVDFWALPQFADPPKERLEPGATAVVFTPK